MTVVDTQADIIAEALDVAAEICDPRDGVPFFAVVMAHREMEAEEIQRAWDRFAGRLRIFRALDTGADHWSLHYGEDALTALCDEEQPTSSALQEAAVQLAAGEADQARRALLDGGQSL